MRTGKPEAQLRERWDRVATRSVRVLETAGADGDTEVVVVPGLGALGYLLPTVVACGEWARVRLLDVPGFGHRSTARCPATLSDVASTVAAWLRSVPSGPVALFGHSTGAQAALRAAVAVPHRVSAVALGGVTFPPAARRWPGLLRGAARTVVHEHPGEIPATFPDYLRGRARVLTLLRTAMDDRPEALAPLLRSHVAVIRGARDALCPAGWASELAACAGDGRVVTVPGAHNFVYTHPRAASAALRGVASLIR